ncbi:Protein CBG27229 [Caenorhabditis briggsae]|uniref:Protein CBG27229 n=1 Tax=Caenorhabditis briggsae TaxID=6238 RepID=B6IFV2_CAEBR|nr:Protein CBG27229 [Caenorhabditis briggsae]CAR98768.1 Protein CBG27229 [Caenorhabditis briggsae]
MIPPKPPSPPPTTPPIPPLSPPPIIPSRIGRAEEKAREAIRAMATLDEHMTEN